MAVVFRKSGGNGNVKEVGLTSIWRVPDNDVGSRDGGQVCEELFPCRSGQSGTSFLASSWNLMSGGMQSGTSFESE